MAKKLIAPGQSAKTKARQGTMSKPKPLKRKEKKLIMPPGTVGMSQARHSLPLPGTIQYEQALNRLARTIGRSLTNTEKRYLHKQVSRLCKGRPDGISQDKGKEAAKLGAPKKKDWAYKV